MPMTRILTRADVARLLTMDIALDAVERAFAAHGRGEARMPVKVYLQLPEHGGDFRAMPATMGGAAGVKWVNSHPDNPRRHGLPAVMGVYILSDPATAAPLAVLDATLLTAMRTGAAAGVATKHLLGRSPKSVGFVGTGVQARFLLDAHRTLWGDLEWRMFDQNAESAERFAGEAGGKATSLAEVAACDAICVATPSRTPVVLRSQIGDGVHVNAMGADAPGKQELDPQILFDGRVFVDDLEQASHSGEVNVPLHEGSYSSNRIAGTLGEVVAGRKQARPADVQNTITVFDSTGLALQDVAVARAVYDAAVKNGVGLEVDLVGV